MALRYIPKIIVFSIICYSSWYAYTYFCDITPPSVTITGVNEQCYHSGDVRCCVQSDKNGVLSAWIDEQPLLTMHKVRADADENEFIVPTKTLANGKHSIKIDCVDTRYHKNRTTLEREFYVDNQPLQAVLAQTGTHKVFQGRTLPIQLQANKEIKKAVVHALSGEYECFPEAKNSHTYECFIPIECEQQPHDHVFTVAVEDNVGNVVRLEGTFEVVMFPFKKEVLTITADKVKEEKSLGRSAKDLEEEIEQLLAQSPHEKLWKGTFCAPIEIQRITCEYGTVRTTQHKGRYAHKAIDVINAPRSVVWAPQDGTIALMDRFDASGNTVIIDHGCGIFSLFYHLDNFAELNVGQKICQGNPIGTIGKTGFATGYHLHWEMRINNIPVDPLQWTHM